MYLRSMTGFARVEGANQDPKKPLAWVWEIKSVNGRNLDIRFRLPSPYDAVEQALRTRLNQAMKRGNVSVTLALKDDGKSDLLIDNEMLQKILNLQKELGQQVEQSRPKITELLSVPGMFRNPKAVEAAVDPNVEKQLLSSFDQCVMAFNNAREKEGKQIEHVLRDQVDKIESLTKEANKSADKQIGSLKMRLVAQLDMLRAAAAPVDENRLAQELAMLATKIDVREELDRLAAHIKAANDLLKDKEPVGRRFDFLAQEFNRETNTLCAKAAEIELTKLGLELKNVIDQMREQVQNIE